MAALVLGLPEVVVPSGEPSPAQHPAPAALGCAPAWRWGCGKQLLRFSGEQQSVHLRVPHDRDAWPFCIRCPRAGHPASPALRTHQSRNTLLLLTLSIVCYLPIYYSLSMFLSLTLFCKLS